MIQTYLKQLVEYAKAYLMLDSRDEYYILNRLLFLLELEDCGIDEPVPSVAGMTGPDSILAPIVDYALSHGIIQAHQTEAFTAQVMDTVSLRPSELQKIFNEKQAVDGKEATDWFHD